MLNIINLWGKLKVELLLGAFVMLFCLAAYAIGHANGNTSAVKTYLPQIAAIKADLNSALVANENFAKDLRIQNLAKEMLALETIKASEDLRRTTKELEAKRIESRKNFAKYIDSVKSTGDPLEDSKLAVQVLQSMIGRK
jgi:hypothetical protein